MYSNPHTSYSHSRPTNISPITTHFSKEVFLNPKSTLEQNPKVIEQDQKLSPGISDEVSVQKPRILEAHESKQFGSGKVRAVPMKQTYDFQRDYNLDLKGVGGSHNPFERSVINKIPFSPIGFKHVKSSIHTLNSNHKSDHLSTEPSVADSNYTSPNYLNELSIKKERATIFGSDLKPPSQYRAIRAPQLSIGSMGDIEKRDSFRTPKAKFNSDSKDFRGNIFGRLPTERMGIKPDPSVINSHISTSTMLGLKEDKNTPPKISQRASLDLNNKNSSSQNKFITSKTLFKMHIMNNIKIQTLEGRV